MCLALITYYAFYATLSTFIQLHDHNFIEFIRLDRYKNAKICMFPI